MRLDRIPGPLRRDTEADARRCKAIYFVACRWQGLGASIGRKQTVMEGRLFHILWPMGSLIAVICFYGWLLWPQLGS